MEWTLQMHAQVHNEDTRCLPGEINPNTLSINIDDSVYG